MTTFSNYLQSPLVGSQQAISLCIENEVSSMIPDGNDQFEYLPVNARSKVLPSKPNMSALVGRKVISDFNKRQEFAEFSANIAGGTVDVISLTMQGALIGLGGPAGNVIALGVGASTNILKEIMLDDIYRSAKDKLRMDLDRYRQEHGNFEAFKLPPGELAKGKKRYDMLFGGEYPVLHPDFDNISEEGLGILNSQLIKMLADADKVLAENDRRLWDEMSEQGSELKAQGKQLKDIEDKLIKNNQAFVEFGNKTIERMENLQLQATEIRQGLDQIRSRVAKNEAYIRANRHDIEGNRKRIQQNTSDIEYLQEYLFGKMDPIEQIRALKAGFFDGMDQNVRKDLESKIELAAKRQAMIKAATGYLDGAQDLIVIADNLGFGVPSEAREAVQAGTHLLNAGMAFASGNYLGAVASITNLAGIGKPKKDVGVERHKQVMEAFGRLAQGQYEILENQGRLLKWSAIIAQGVDIIIDNQKVMFDAMAKMMDTLNTLVEGQEKIYNGIVSLSNQVQQHHEIVMKEFAYVVHELVMIRFAIRAEGMEEMSSAQSALEMMFEHPGYLPRENRFRNHKQLADFFKNAQNDLRPAIKAGIQKAANAGTLSDANFFQLKSIEVEDHDNDPREHTLKFYRDLRALAIKRSGSTGESGRKLMLASLIIPCTKCDDIQKKQAALKATSEVERLPQRMKQTLQPSGGLDSVSVERLLLEYYDPTFLHKFVSYALRFHYFFQMVIDGDINNDMETVEQLAKAIKGDVPLSDRGKVWLSDCMVRLDVAIAQQSLIQGDYMLPEFAYLFNLNPKGEEQSDYVAMNKLFEKRYQLSHNALLYTFRKNVDGRYIEYHIAYNNIADAEPLKKLLGNYWKFTWNNEDKRWFVKLDSREDALPIPSAVELHKGELMNTPELKKLLDLRHTLAQEIALYDFPAELNEFEREVYLQGVATAI